jgi:hypothetical protein
MPLNRTLVWVHRDDAVGVLVVALADLSVEVRRRIAVPQ